MDDFTEDVGESVVAAAVAVGEASVVDAHEMEQGGVQVVDVDFIVDRVPTEFVGGAVSMAGFDAAAGEPHGEAEGVMFAAVGAFGGGGAAEFAAPEDDGVVEQAVGFEVGEQGGDGFVGGGAIGG